MLGSVPALGLAHLMYTTQYSSIIHFINGLYTFPASAFAVLCEKILLQHNIIFFYIN
jgi:hypothetical protein